jgi:very-short-patch-repair endonuclease
VKSPAETLLAVQLEQAGIPFDREYRFSPERKWRADFLMGNHDGPFGNYMVLIEVDGGTWLPEGGRHTRGPGFERDAEKLNAAAELGYRVLRFTPRMVESGEALAQIKRILGMDKAA